jgi:hypothetical protein
MINARTSHQPPKNSDHLNLIVKIEVKQILMNKARNSQSARFFFVTVW